MNPTAFDGLLGMLRDRVNDGTFKHRFFSFDDYLSRIRPQYPNCSEKALEVFALGAYAYCIARDWAPEYNGNWGWLLISEFLGQRADELSTAELRDLIPFSWIIAGCPTYLLSIPEWITLFHRGRIHSAGRPIQAFATHAPVPRRRLGTQLGHVAGRKTLRLPTPTRRSKTRGSFSKRWRNRQRCSRSGGHENRCRSPVSPSRPTTGRCPRPAWAIEVDGLEQLDWRFDSAGACVSSA